MPDFYGGNGKRYRWGGPGDGIPQGGYEPGTYLVTPKKQQVVSMGAVYAINEKTSLSTEVAMSNYDVNALSDKDKGDNKGFAGKINVDHLIAFRTNGGKVLQLKTAGGYEVTEKTFQPV